MMTIDILGVPITTANLHEAVARVEQWIGNNQKTYVTVTGVHGIMESQYDGEVKIIHQAAGMCLPDGMPAVWIGRLHGYKKMRRVYGPDLMLEVMRRSVDRGFTHFCYGGREGVPELLKERLLQKIPGLRIVGTFSPPFRPMTEEEEKELESSIQQLSPDIIWVGLSTPKQEKWMAEHVENLNAKVMIGVGAAFDFHSGLVRQAPSWIQQIGMEWFFRLCVEPRRLWRRYLRNNPRFIYLLLRQMLSNRKKN